MKLKKQALIQAIDTVQAEEKRQIKEYDIAFKKRAAKHDADWLRESAPRWTGLRDYLSNHLRRATGDKLITQEGVNNAMGMRDRYESWPYYKEFNSTTFTLDGKQYSKITPNCELTPLKCALEAIEDDFVTPTSLASIGFKDLGWLFRKALLQ